MRCHRLLPVLALLAALAVPGCDAQARVSYIPEAGSYAAADLPAALEDSDPGRAARTDPSEAVAARQEALADLRTYGEDAARLADVLTSEFPTDTASIPYAIEAGTFDGEPAWIVFEAWGDAGEPLAHRRAWVFSREDLSLLAAEASR